MSENTKTDPLTPPIYHGDQDADRLPYDGPAIRTEPQQDNRGRRAAREGSGVVSGSGAAAGGTGGIEEDFGDDPIGGGGPNMMPVGRAGSTESPGHPGTPLDEVRLEDDDDILYWTNRFGVSEERLRAAVARAGTSIDAVAEDLNR